MKKIMMLVLIILMVSIVPVTTQAKTSAQTRITQTERKIKKKFKRIKIVEKVRGITLLKNFRELP